MNKYVCKMCGRHFTSKQALGGHMAHAHPQGDPPQSRWSASPGAGRDDLPPPQHDESEASQIREYVRDGYSFHQLTQRFGFNPRTVRQELAKTTLPEQGGKRNNEDSLPATYRKDMVLNPEALLRRYADGSDEDEAELRGIMKMKAAMLMVMDLVGIEERQAKVEETRANALVKMLRATREENKQANQQLAKDTAEHAVTQVYNAFEQLLQQHQPQQPQQGGGSNPVRDTLNRTMANMMERMMGMMGMPTQGGHGGQQTGQQQNLPSGWQVKEKTQQ